MQNLNSKDYGYGQTKQETVLNGDFVFNDNLPMSKKSCFGDAVWDWTDEDNQRLKVLSDAKIRFDWDAVTVGTAASKQAVKFNHQEFLAILPAGIVEDIKRAALIYAKFPNLTQCRGPNTKTSGRKAITVVHFIKITVNFFAYIYLQNLLPSGNSKILTLADISLSDIRRNIAGYPYRTDEVRKVLMKLNEDVIKRNLKNPFTWNRADLRNLSWPSVKIKEHIEPLPDELFRLLSETSRKLVLRFLNELGQTTFDDQSKQKLHSKKRWDRFPEMFESYVQRRQLTRDKGSGWASSHTKIFVSKFGVQPESIKDYLMDVHCAAQTLILLYTGMRYSEAALVQTGCLVQRDNVYFIKSTITKKRGKLPINTDEWIAIDIVRDAVRALELLSRANFNNFLFANFDTLRKNQPENPLSHSGLGGRLNDYLKKIDKKKVWSGWVLSTHQFRHGLVQQLARAEVGIPYITRQLHHYYSKLNEASYRVNESTLVYGLQKQRLVANASGLNAVRRAGSEILHDLYGSNRNFAGGGAARHVERTEAFFTGLGIEGKQRDAYIDNLAKSGVAIVQTAVGWCTRNHVEPNPDEKEVPPCIGDLACNPSICKHSVVPELRKFDVIRFYLNAVHKLESPEQIHLKKHWEKARDSFAAMLRQLDVDPNSLNPEEN
ncbi:MAG: site-specific integrase [Pyrinomonadaceae bacterium]